MMPFILQKFTGGRKMKLSEAQNKVLEIAHIEIDEARKFDTYEEYFMKYESMYKNASYNTPEKYKAKDPEGWKRYKKYWENRRNGIVLTHCNSRTLWKLEELGYIKIINDSCGQYTGIDTIQILNY